MVANNQIKVAALALSLGIVLATGIDQAAQAKSSRTTKTDASQSAKSGKSARSGSANVQGDEAAVRAQLTAFSTQLAAGDAKALALFWSEDGEYVDEDGNQTRGRKAIEQRFDMVFGQEGKPHVQLAADTVKFLAPTVALVEGTVQRDRDGQSMPASHFSLVMVKANGGWMLTRAAERSVVATSNYDYLRHFDWLVGEWGAQSSSASVHMKAEWVPSKNFILCKYETKKADGTQSVDMQIIGWDPILEQPRSWHFDSSGGFGNGLWTKVKNQWVCDTTGVESDGSETKSRNIISVTGADSFSWSSVNRSVDGMAVGDAPELQVKRTVR